MFAVTTSDHMFGMTILSIISDRTVAPTGSDTVPAPNASCVHVGVLQTVHIQLLSNVFTFLKEPAVPAPRSAHFAADKTRF